MDDTQNDTSEPVQELDRYDEKEIDDLFDKLEGKTSRRTCGAAPLS